MGLTTPSRENKIVTETATSENTRTDQLDDDPRNRTRNMNWKKTHNFGTWNVRTLNRTGAAEEFEQEMKRYKMAVTALQEIRWPGQGRKDMKDGSIFYSGRREGKHEEGVGFYIKKEIVPDVCEFEPISSRIARLRLATRWFKVTMIAAHAPTDVSADATKDEWYGQLQGVINRVPRHDPLIILGDWNAKIGRDNAAFQGTTGTHSLHTETTDNGLRMLTFAMQNGLIVGASFFQHKDIHKETWTSPDSRTTNQIDHILVRSRFKSALMDVRSFRGADCDSDHYLVVAKVKIRLSTPKKKVTKTMKFDIEKLKDENVRREYQIELQNRFEMIGEEEIGWNGIKTVVLEAAKEKIGLVKKKRKEWYDDECQAAAENRRKYRRIWLAERRNDAKRETFRGMRRRAKKVNRKKKREFINDKMRGIEYDRRSRRTRDQFQGINEIRKGYQPRGNMIRNKEGEMIVNREEIKQR